MKSVRSLFAAAVRACFSSGVSSVQVVTVGPTNHPASEGHAAKPTAAPSFADRYRDENQGCSYFVPDGLEKKESRNGKTKFAGPKGSPMVTFYSEAYEAPLQQYADAYLDALKKDYPHLQVEHMRPFITDGGIEGITLSVTNTLQGMDLVEVVYCIAGREDKKIAAACTVLARDIAQYRPAFEACGKSLALLP